jgi:photosystem II stability/assembly factor-like uncharacterized protein
LFLQLTRQALAATYIVLRTSKNRNNDIMKKGIIVIFLFLFYHSFAQWQFLYCPTNRNLWSVSFVDDNLGFIVGDTGTIIKTTNGGATWTVQTNVTANSLYSVHFLNADTGFAVGHNRILRTTDGGLSWTEQFNQAGFVAYSICFPTHSIGYVVGSNGFIIKSEDYGTTWNYLYTGFGRDFYSVNFPTKDTGYVAGCFSGSGGRITLIKTTDGGTSWISVGDTNFRWTTLYSVFFTNSQNGYVVGEENNGIIFKTINGGNTWTHQYLPLIPSLHSVYFTNDNMGYCVGSEEQIWKTTNGSDWVNQFYGFWLGRLNSVTFINDTVGYAVGHGIIMKTTNGGVVGLNSQLPNDPEEFNISPNPAKNLIMISCKSKCFGEIIESHGKIVKTFFHNETEQKIDVSDMCSGIYLMKLLTERNVILTKKLIVLK